MMRTLLPLLALSSWCLHGNADETVQSDELALFENRKPIRSPEAQREPQPCRVVCEPTCCVPPARCCMPKNPCPMKDCIQCEGHYFTADFLYWRAENNGFTYGFDDFPSSDASGLFHGLNGEFLRIDGEWDPGFRIGYGWNSGYDYWDIYANYTWFLSEADEEHHRGDLTPQAVVGGGVGGILQLNPVGIGGGPFIDATANWDLHLNVGDVEIGRGLYLTKHLAIRPHWGARIAFIDQEFRDHFFTPVNLNAFPPFVETKEKAESDYWGLGPRAGINAEWHTFCGFSVIGKAATALLYGKDRVKHTTKAHIKSIALGDEGFFTIDSMHDDYWQLVPTLQMLLGFQWSTCFNCDSMYYNINICWETNYWWDQYNTPKSVGCPTSCRSTQGPSAPMANDGIHALTMEGLTLNMEFDF